MPVYKYQEFKTSDGTVFELEEDAHEHEVRYKLRTMLESHSVHTNVSESIFDTIIDLLVSDAEKLRNILNDYLDEETYNYK